MTEIHPQLLADCILLGRFPLCRVLLMNDSQYPWFILVPDREAIREIYQLDDIDRTRLWDESCRLSAWLMATFEGDKFNLAALGNQVAQLHLHHIVRYRGDPAWPAPVWGRHPAIPYTEKAVNEIRAKLARSGLNGFEAISEPGIEG